MFFSGSPNTIYGTLSVFAQQHAAGDREVMMFRAVEGEQGETQIAESQQKLDGKEKEKLEEAYTEVEEQKKPHVDEFPVPKVRF